MGMGKMSKGMPYDSNRGLADLASLAILADGKKNPDKYKTGKNAETYQFLKSNYEWNYNNYFNDYTRKDMLNPSDLPGPSTYSNSTITQTDTINTSQPAQNQMAAAAQTNAQASSQPQVPVESAPIGQGFQGTPDVPLGGSNLEEAFKKKTGSILLR